jgi:hypothetical protein
VTRLISPDSDCIGVDVGAHRYNGRRLEVTDPTDVKLLKAYGYVDPGPGGVAVKARGFTCPACGFRGYFRTCGRCRSAAHRD